MKKKGTEGEEKKGRNRGNERRKLDKERKRELEERTRKKGIGRVEKIGRNRKSERRKLDREKKRKVEEGTRKKLIKGVEKGRNRGSEKKETEGIEE